MNNDSTKLLNELNECPYEACKNGDLIKVKQLINKSNVNLKDTSGRKSTCLHFACGYGRTDICEYLLNDCQADPCIKDTGGLEPIHNASSFGHLDVIQLLLKYKANINALDNWNWTPLHEAVSKSRIDVILVLVKNKADLNIKNLDGKTPIDLCNEKNVQDIFNGEYKKDEFMESIRTGDVDKFTQLLTPFNLNCNTNDGRRSTPLHLASGYNKSKLVKILLENGANIHSIDKGGLVPLHNACSYGHIETASLLLENGADPNIGDMWSFTPLHEAVLKKRKEISSLLLSYKGDPYIKNCYGKSSLDLCKEQNDDDDDLYNFILNEFMGYSLITAVKENNFLNVKKILNENVTLINFKHSRLNETVLTAAFNEKNYQLIDYLIKRGADLYLTNLDKTKKTLLHKSVESMDLECIYIFLNLIKNDFELNMQLYDDSLSNFIDAKLIDLNGESPLHYAARLNSFQICKILIMFGFEINRKSVNNFYPHDLCTDESLKNFLLEKFDLIKLDEDRNLCKQSLLEACKSGNLDVVKSIISKYSDLVNCNDKEGRLSTPLHFASGYNRLEVCKYLIENGANIFACDKGLLQPIHNAASYGHVEIANLLIKSGCNLNAQDAYLYTPLHEATVKKKYEICKFLVKNGADPSIRNRDGMSSIDLAIQLGDEDLIDILKDFNGLLEACKYGNFDKVKKLVNDENINCCETTGRKSSLLHLAAGFNHIKIAEYLLEKKINTEIRDKGGLVALHNAASYGHVEMAALLLKYNPNLINLTDKWGYTALHEAAQKGRTQMCALLLDHGIDASIRNQDSKTALDLAEADDVKILLENSMPLFSVKCVKQVKTHTNKSDINLSNRDESELDGSEFEPSSQCLTKTKLINNKTAKSIKYNKSKQNESGDGCMDFSLKNTSKFDQLTLNDFLTEIDEASLIEIFEREKINLEILSEMTNEQLKEIGIEAYGSRHKILKSIENLLIKFNDPFYDVPQTGSLIIELDINENEFEIVKNEMLNSIRVHKDDNSNQTIKHYEILKIEKIKNRRLWSRYLNRKKEIQEENMGHENERFLFHGSPFLMNIIEKGFDERHACIYGLFGAGLYFAENSSKSNQYIYGIGGGPGCPEHKNKNCTECSRQLLLCRVCLGKSYVLLTSNKLAHAPPGHHSVCGRPSQGGLVYPEYVVYRGEQAYPEYLITYKIAE